MSPRSPSCPGASVLTAGARRLQPLDPGALWGGQHLWSVIVLLLLPFPWILATGLPVAAQAPGPGLQDPFIVSGTSIPAHLEGLEEAQIDYLKAWNGGDVSSILRHLAPGAQALTRSGVVEAEGLRGLLLRVVPRTRLRGASIFLVDDADGWVSVGTLLDMDLEAEGHSGPHLGSSLMVWAQGPDDRWLLVFLGALWIRADGEFVTEARRRVGRADSVPGGGGHGTILLAPAGPVS